MAKLSAYNQHEVLRLERENHTPDGDLTVWERRTLVVMNTGRVLEKLDVRFRPDRYDPAGRRHSYGWKVKGKLRPTATLNAVREAYERAGWRAVPVRFAPIPWSKSVVS
jgi:hypothetical protein